MMQVRATVVSLIPAATVATTLETTMNKGIQTVCKSMRAKLLSNHYGEKYLFMGTRILPK